MGKPNTNPLSRMERETHIRRNGEDAEWEIFTDDPVMIRKLTKLHGDGKPSGQFGRAWKVSRRSVSFRKPTFHGKAAGRFRTATYCAIAGDSGTRQAPGRVEAPEPARTPPGGPSGE